MLKACFNSAKGCSFALHNPEKKEGRFLLQHSSFSSSPDRKQRLRGIWNILSLFLAGCSFLGDMTWYLFASLCKATGRGRGKKEGRDRQNWLPNKKRHQRSMKRLYPPILKLEQCFFLSLNSSSRPATTGLLFMVKKEGKSTRLSHFN